MQVDFFNNFYKKDNSTKQPTVGGAGNLTNKYTVTGNLKEPCSILHPVISLQETPVTSAIPAVCTYAYIPLFSRYYWVTDWTWENGLWAAHMSVDVLASWKTAIGGETEYILRTDSTTNFNEDITDITYPATTDVSTETYKLTNIFTTNIDAGCYIVGIISGGQTQAVGAISYYAMTSAQFGALKDKLFSDDNLEIMGIIDSSGQQLVQDLSQEVLKTLYNPYQYIVSCMWFPFGVSAITSSTAVSAIKIGWWEYPLTGNRIFAQTIEIGNEDFTIDAHPQAATRGSYLNYAPYTTRTIIGRFGTFPVDTTMFKVGHHIIISYNIDLITGQCIARLNRRDVTVNPPAEDIFAERNFLIGVPIQIAQVGTDYLGTTVSAINGVSGTIGSAVSGFAAGGIAGAIGGAIAGAANGIYNTLQSAMPQVETSGQNGSFLAPYNQTKVIEQFYNIVDEDIEHRGRPLCELRQINTLSGFILCAEGDLDLDVYEAERTEIKRFLTTGFFWE